MLKSKLFWYNLMAGAILLWPGVVFAGYYFEKPSLGWGIFLGLVVLHASEIKKGIEVGTARGLSKSRSAFKTFIFGFTWWVPLGMNVLDR